MIIKLDKVNDSMVSRILNSVFIYPTDTIYGIGCNAEDEELVEKIRKIKGRDNKPFSIIAPNVDYILENCEVEESLVKKYLPGAYTLILKKKDKTFLKGVSDTEYIGVRIPDHEFTKILQKTCKPIVTTSVNFSGEKPITKVSEIDESMMKEIDFVVDSGVLDGSPSTLIKDGEIIRRS